MRRITFLKICLCIFFAGSQIFLNAQEGKDSLSALPNDTVKVRLLLRAVQKLSFGSAQSATYALQALSISDKESYLLGQRSAASYLGNYYFLHGDYDGALSYYKLSMQAAEKLGMQKEAAAMMMGIGLSFYAKTDLQQSLTWHLKSLKIREAIGDSAGISASYIHLANLYQYRGDLDQAMQYNLKALEMKKKLNDKDGQIYCNSNIGAIFGQRKNYPRSLSYYEQALRLAREINNERLIANTLANIGSVYQSLNRYRQALECMKEALAISKRIDDKEGQAGTLNIIGNLQVNNGDLKQAAAAFEQSLELAEEMGALELMKLNHQKLAELYHRRSEDHKAYFHMNAYAALKDSILNIKNQESLNHLQELYQSEKKDKALLQKDHEIERQNLRSSRQILLIAFIVLILLLGGLFTLALFNRLKLIRTQKITIEVKQKEIFDSINYALRIQQALLASRQTLEEHLEDHFVYFKPKDIVSGDFYWAANVSEEDSAVSLPSGAGAGLMPAGGAYFFLAVCDSTGHGVPGAFMSLLNIGFLSEAIKEKNIHDCGEVFNYVRRRLTDSISAEGQKDGFDGILLRLDTRNRHLTYSAANNAPVLVSKGQMKELPADKMPVGKGEKEDLFSTCSISYEPGDILYLFTDGYPDQFGGPKGKKFKYSQLEKLLLSISGLPLSEQKEVLDDTFRNWKGPLEQIDDVCVIGIRL